MFVLEGRREQTGTRITAMKKVGRGRPGSGDDASLCELEGSGRREARVMRSDCMGWKKFVKRNEWLSAGDREEHTHTHTLTRSLVSKLMHTAGSDGVRGIIRCSDDFFVALVTAGVSTAAVHFLMGDQSFN